MAPFRKQNAKTFLPSKRLDVQLKSRDISLTVSTNLGLSTHDSVTTSTTLTLPDTGITSAIEGSLTIGVTISSGDPSSGSPGTGGPGTGSSGDPPPGDASGATPDPPGNTTVPAPGTSSSGSTGDPATPVESPGSSPASTSGSTSSSNTSPNTTSGGPTDVTTGGTSSSSTGSIPSSPGTTTTILTTAAENGATTANTSNKGTNSIPAAGLNGLDNPSLDQGLSTVATISATSNAIDGTNSGSQLTTNNSDPPTPDSIEATATGVTFTQASTPSATSGVPVTTETLSAPNDTSELKTTVVDPGSNSANLLVSGDGTDSTNVPAANDAALNGDGNTGTGSALVGVAGISNVGNVGETVQGIPKPTLSTVLSPSGTSVSVPSTLPSVPKNGHLLWLIPLIIGAVIVAVAGLYVARSLFQRWKHASFVPAQFIATLMRTNKKPRSGTPSMVEEDGLYKFIGRRIPSMKDDVSISSQEGLLSSMSFAGPSTRSSNRPPSRGRMSVVSHETSSVRYSVSNSDIAHYANVLRLSVHLPDMVTDSSSVIASPNVDRAYVGSISMSSPIEPPDMRNRLPALSPLEMQERESHISSLISSNRQRGRGFTVSHPPSFRNNLLE